MNAAQDYIDRKAAVWCPDGWPVWACMPERVTPDAVKTLQALLGLKEDGYPGPLTVDACAREDMRRQQACQQGFYVLIGPRACLVPGMKGTTYVDDPALADTPTTRRAYAAHQLVIHYDVTFSASATHKVLVRRGLSTHFCVDHDGAIIQHHNPALVYCYHVGSKGNAASVGIDLNNPADPDYRARDARIHGRARDLVTASVHGQQVECLNYHPEQIAAARELVTVLCDALKIPQRAPRDARGHMALGVIDDAHHYEGITGHYHHARRKIDPIPLQWEDLE